MTRLAITLMAAFCVAALSLAAHEGHTHKTMGTATMVSETQLAVKDDKGLTTIFTLDGKTKIWRGRTALLLADIKVGERVVVTYEDLKTKSGKVNRTVKTVQVGVTPVVTKTGINVPPESRLSEARSLPAPAWSRGRRPTP
jgi:hypothetical protein